MNHLFVIDYSFIKKFQKSEKWEALFTYFTKDDYVIFSGKKSEHLKTCKSFIKKKVKKNYSDEHFKCYKDLFNWLSARYEKIKDNPHNNRFTFWGELPVKLLVELQKKCDILVKYNHFYIFNVLTEGSFEKLTKYAIDAHKIEAFFHDIISKIRKYKEKELALNTTIYGREGIYDNYRFSLEQMIAMLKAIPVCVEKLNLRMWFNAMQSKDRDNDVIKVLKCIPNTVKSFDIDLHPDTDKLCDKVAKHFVKENEEAVFLNQLVEPAPSQEPKSYKSTRSLTFPFVESMGKNIAEHENIDKDKLIKSLQKTVLEQEKKIEKLTQGLHISNKKIQELQEKNKKMEEQVDDPETHLDKKMAASAQESEVHESPQFGAH